MTSASRCSTSEAEVPADRHLALAEPPASENPRAATDSELVAALLSADATCASALYERLHPAVDRALLRVFGRRDDEHDDLVQVALEQIVRSVVRGRYRGACSLPTWAATIASRVGLAELRQRYRHRAVFVSAGGTLPPAEAPPRAHESIDLVRRALAQLNRERALVLFMHDTEGYSLREIAATLSTSVAAAQSRLVRARKQFITCYDKLCAEAELCSGSQGTR